MNYTDIPPIDVSIWNSQWTAPKTLEEKALHQCNIKGRKTIGSLLISSEVRTRLANANIFFLDELQNKTATELSKVGIASAAIIEIESILSARDRRFHGFKK